MVAQREGDGDQQDNRDHRQQPDPARRVVPRPQNRGREVGAGGHADTDGPVFLIVDGHPTHRAKKVTAFVKSTNGRLRLYRLPGYCPQLNPDEWVWKNVKHDRVGRSGITGPDQFRALAVGGLRRLQAMPHIVRGFFRDPDLAYISAAAAAA